MYRYIIFLLTICLLAACSKGGGKGVKYQIHTSKGTEKAKIGDFLTLNLQYATEKDSVIFSSYKKPKPLSFKFQPTLFKGVLNDGLAKMGAGDSATFLVPADSLYGQRMPKFLKSGDRIKYTLTLLKVQSQEEYQKEKIQERANMPQSTDTTNRPLLKLSPEQLKKGMQQKMVRPSEVAPQKTIKEGK